MTRIYPSRGDYVHVVEGGFFWVGNILRNVLTGGHLIVLDRVEDENGNLEGVWVKSAKLGQILVYNSSWAPVEGPPSKVVIVEPYKSMNEKGY